MENVSWEDILSFLAKLNVAHKRKGGPCGLPTEAQWEYACRAGTTTFWHCGDSEAVLQEYAWLVANAGGKTHPVGQLRPNGFGLHDMHGNAWEWCTDWYGADYYAQLPPNDPRGELLLRCSVRHREHGLAAVTSEHYAGAHWLGSFAVYLLTQRGLDPAS